jgi:hypothetical protein
MKPDTGNIGQDKPVQDPQDAVEAVGGRYEDAVLKRPVTETIDYMPKGPDPQPFTLRGRAGGG